MLYTRSMRRKKRSLLSLCVGSIAILSLVLLIIYIPPTFSLKVGAISLSILYLFFSLLSLTIASFTYFLTKSKLHGVLVALLLSSFLLFRMNGLTHPFFIFLLIALFLTLELLFTKPRQ